MSFRSLELRAGCSPPAANDSTIEQTSSWPDNRAEWRASQCLGLTDKRTHEDGASTEGCWCFRPFANARPDDCSLVLQTASSSSVYFASVHLAIFFCLVPTRQETPSSNRVKTIPVLLSAPNYSGKCSNCTIIIIEIVQKIFYWKRRRGFYEFHSFSVVAFHHDC